MTNYKNTDKIIQEKYNSMDPVIDIDTMWEELVPIIEKKKNRGILFWFFLMASCIVIFGLAAFQLLNNDIDKPIVNADNTIFATDHVLETSRVGLDKSELLNASLENNKDSSLRSNIDNNISVENPLVNTLLNSKNEFKTHNNQTTNSSYFSDKHSTEIVADISANLIDEDKWSSGAVIDQISDGNVALSKRESIVALDIPSLDISTTYDRNALVKTNTSDWTTTSYIQPLLRNQWRIAINGGYYIHSRSFDDLSDDPSSNYISRSMEEEAKDGYDLGVKLEYFISDHFVLMGGLRFSQSFVQRNADYYYTETITLEDHVVAIINTEQGPIEVKENIVYDGVFNHLADNYITATRLGLVTGMQYRIGVDRWTTHVDLGIEVPFWSSHSGIITNNNRPYNLSDETETIHTTALQLFGGIGIEYSLSTSAAIQATIGGYMPLNNEQVESYAIDKRSTLIGLNLGIHFRL